MSDQGDDPREALKRAHELYDRLAAEKDPSVLERLLGPGSRLKAQIEAELIELELIAQGLGI